MNEIVCTCLGCSEHQTHWNMLALSNGKTKKKKKMDERTNDSFIRSNWRREIQSNLSNDYEERKKEMFVVHDYESMWIFSLNWDFAEWMHFQYTKLTTYFHFMANVFVRDQLSCFEIYEFIRAQLTRNTCSVGEYILSKKKVLEIWMFFFVRSCSCIHLLSLRLIEKLLSSAKFDLLSFKSALKLLKSNRWYQFDCHE